MKTGAPVMQAVTTPRATSTPASCSPTRTLREHRRAMRKRFLVPAALALFVAAATPGVASAADYAPGQVVVKYRGENASQKVETPDGQSVKQTFAALKDNPGVAYAVPN